MQGSGGQAKEWGRKQRGFKLQVCGVLETEHLAFKFLKTQTKTIQKVMLTPLHMYPLSNFMGKQYMCRYFNNT